MEAVVTLALVTAVTVEMEVGGVGNGGNGRDGGGWRW